MLVDDFIGMLKDRINQLHVDASLLLVTPPSAELAKDTHEIGTLRGYLRALKEVYEEMDEVVKTLNERK